MNKLEKFFDLVGVQPNIEFQLMWSDGEYKRGSYMFNPEGELLMLNSNGSSYTYNIPCILTGELVIVLKPFKPKTGQEYWYIDIDGETLFSNYSPKRYVLDVTNVISGNCFPSSNISDEYYQIIKDKFKDAGVDVSDWVRH